MEEQDRGGTERAGGMVARAVIMKVKEVVMV
jgi:hypothetical protein